MAQARYCTQCFEDISRYHNDLETIKKIRVRLAEKHNIPSTDILILEWNGTSYIYKHENQ